MEMNNQSIQIQMLTLQWTNWTEEIQLYSNENNF